MNGANEKNAQFDKITEELNKLKTEYGTIEVSKKELEKKLEETDKSTADSAMHVDDGVEKANLEKELTEVRTKATEGEKLVEALKLQIATKEEEIAKVRSESSEVAASTSAAAVPAENVESAVETTVVQSTDAHAASGEVQQLKQKLGAVESELADHKAKVLSLQVTIKEKEGQIKKQVEQIKRLEMNSKVKDRSLAGMREQVEKERQKNTGQPVQKEAPKAPKQPQKKNQNEKQPEQTEQQSEKQNEKVAVYDSKGVDANGSADAQRVTQTPQPAQPAQPAPASQPAQANPATPAAQTSQPVQATPTPAPAVTPEHQQAPAENIGEIFLYKKIILTAP